MMGHPSIPRVSQLVAVLRIFLLFIWISSHQYFGLQESEVHPMMKCEDSNDDL